MFVSIIPMGAPRQTARDRWGTNKRPVVERYHAYRDELRLKYHGTYPERVSLIFYMPMPASWSKKKRERMVSTPHQVKPDGDNLQKAVQDALCVEDGYVWEAHVIKIWSATPGVEITEIKGYNALAS